MDLALNNLQWLMRHENKQNQTKKPLRYQQYVTKVSKVGDRSQGRPEGSLFNSYYTEV